MMPLRQPLVLPAPTTRQFGRRLARMIATMRKGGRP